MGSVEKDPKWPTDDHGPRGFKRCWVKTKDKITKYEDVGTSSEFTKHEKLNKKASEEQIRAKIDQVFNHGLHEINDAGGDDEGKADIMTSAGLQARAMTAMASGCALDGSLTAPTIDDIQEKSVKKRKKGADDDLLESDGDAPPEKAAKDKDKEKDADGNGDGGLKNEDWLEPAKVNRATRAYEKKLNALQTAITEQKRKMSEVIKEFDSKPEKREVADRLRSEMSLVRSRLVWLDSVDGADEKKLASMIQEVIKVGSVNAANSAPEESHSSSSRDISILARAGPCPNFEKLGVFSMLEKHKVIVAAATNIQELTERSDAQNAQFKLLHTLIHSCKTAVVDLNGAYTALEAERKEKIAEDTEKKKKMGQQGLIIKEGPPDNARSP